MNTGEKDEFLPVRIDRVTMKELDELVRAMCKKSMVPF